MKKPSIAPLTESLLTQLAPQRLLEILTIAPSGQHQAYYHWDELRRRTLHPMDLALKSGGSN